MVKLTEQRNLEEKLTRELSDASDPETRCPNLKIDENGLYCSKDLTGEEPISKQRREICDNASLQLWCLDNTRYVRCIWYNSEPFR